MPVHSCASWTFLHVPVLDACGGARAVVRFAVRHMQWPLLQCFLMKRPGASWRTMTQPPNSRSMASRRGTICAKPGRAAGSGCQHSRMSCARLAGVCAGTSGRSPRCITASAAWMPLRPA